MAGFKPRKIDFPDHTADDFDPSVIVTHNGIDYSWNGKYGWEVVCKGGGAGDDSTTGREFHKELVPQLRGTFELDADGNAIAPDNAFYLDTEDNALGWSNEIVYPGIWWRTTATNNSYSPKYITHLLVTSYRYIEGVNDDDQYIYGEHDFAPKFFPGDIIRVYSSENELYHEDAHGDYLEEYIKLGGRYDDIWRVTEVLNVTHPTYSVKGFRAYEVEKVRPSDQYSYGWSVDDDTEGDDWWEKQFNPIWVTNHYTYKEVLPFLQYKKRISYSYWTRGQYQLSDSRGYTTQIPKEAVGLKFTHPDYRGFMSDGDTWKAGDTISFYSDEGQTEVASFHALDVEESDDNYGRFIKITLDKSKTTGDDELEFVFYNIPNPAYKPPVEAYDDQWIRDDQDRQDKEIEELQELTKLGGCSEYSWMKISNPSNPFVDSHQASIINDHSLMLAKGIITDTELESKDTFKIEDIWESRIVSIGDARANGSQQVYDVEFEDKLPDEVLNDPLNWAWQPKVYGCSVGTFVTHPELEADQKRQDDALAEEIQARAERDLTHDAQINTIEYKLDALVGLQFKGVYEFKHENDCNLEYERCVANCMALDPQDHECRQLCGYNQMDCERDKVRPGYFEAVDPDDQFDHLEYIVISRNDKAGVEIDWAGVLDAGDYLEVDHTADGVLDKTNYGLYRILEEPEHGTNAYGEDVYTLHLEFLQGDGVMNVRENYEIRGITAAEGISPEELGDFLTKEEAAATYALKTHGHPWGDITGKPSSYPPSSHTHSDYVSKSDTNDQQLNGNLKGKYFYGSSSSMSNGFLTRSTIETMISNAGGGGSDGSDHNHDSRYPRMSTGTSSNPSPSTGDFYLDTSRKVLYIGV